MDDADEESGEIDTYMWKDLTMTVNGMDWDDHWLNFTFEELNETEGNMVYVGSITCMGRRI